MVIVINVVFIYSYDYSLQFIVYSLCVCICFMLVVDFPCWALGSFLYVLYVQENSYGSGKILGGLGMCIEGEWNQLTARTIRG